MKGTGVSELIFISVCQHDQCAYRSYTDRLILTFCDLNNLLILIVSLGEFFLKENVGELYRKRMELPCISVLIVLDNKKSSITHLLSLHVIWYNIEKSMIHPLHSIISFVQIVHLHYKDNTPVKTLVI
jgi:hypothetical protein